MKVSKSCSGNGVTVLVAFVISVCLVTVTFGQRVSPPGDFDINQDFEPGIPADTFSLPVTDTLEPVPWPPPAERFVEAAGGSCTEKIYGSTSTSDGCIVTTGYTDGFDSDGKSLILSKFDSHGVHQWTTMVDGSGSEEGRCVIETFDGNLVVTGYTNSFGGPKDNLLLAKFDSEGNRIWTKVMKRDYTPIAGALDFYGYSVIEDTDHNLVVTGHMHRGTPSRNSLLFAKFDSGGNRIYVSTVFNLAYVFRDHYGCSITQRCDGGYLAAGWVDGSNIGVEMLLVRFYTGGTLDTVSWISESGSANDEKAYSIIRTSDCGFAITGYSGNDLVVLKRDYAVNPVWGKKMGANSSEGRSVIETFDDGIVVTGKYSIGSGNLLLSKWDFTGSPEWSRSYGKTSGFDIGHSVFEDTNHMLAAAGYTDSWGAGGKDILVIRCDSNGITCLEDQGGPGCGDWNPLEGRFAGMAQWTPSEIEVLDWQNPTIAFLSPAVKIVCPTYPDIRPIVYVDGAGKLPAGDRQSYKLANFPNPFNPATKIQFSIPTGDHVTLEVYNIMGQKVATPLDNYLSAGEHSVEWHGTNSDGRPVASGIYFYRLQVGDYSETRKMLLLK